MKQPKDYFLILITLLICHSISAQDKFKPWNFGIGINAINNPVTGLSDPLTGLSIESGRYKTWNMNPSGVRLTISRYLKSGFIFEPVLSYNVVKENDPNSNEEFPYLSLDGMFKYNLSASSEPVNRINPYVGIGGGYTWLDKIGSGTLNGTFGINFWIFNNVGLNVQSTVKKAFKDYGLTHFQYSAGIVFRAGTSDWDKDGIPDDDDECPKEFGLASLNGCPDSDGDAIRDIDDGCPNEPGLIQFNGCPDSDGDGIIDKNDECPNEKGILETNGCPDSDGDGIPDKSDKCPGEVGPVSNEGCPYVDSDQDGVVDKDDQCPNQIGTVANNGCPEGVTVEDEAKIASFARTILFNYGKTTLRASSKTALDEIFYIMQTYGDAKFSIEGHTDNTDGQSYNLLLSIKRAREVKRYLVNKGMDASRLDARGFGESRPISSNKTKQGRKENRRVEIILQN